MRVVILTGSELRHNFVRKALALGEGVEVLATYCEKTDDVLPRVIVDAAPGADLQRRHLAARARSEEDFFRTFAALAPDRSGPRRLSRGAINTPAVVREIMDMAPDLLVAYGCSLVKAPLIEAFKGRFLNVHLGLSPYYRGAGTNFWPLVNAEPQFVGATFMHMDAGVDTGEIIHQLRADVHPGDSPHQIGNRLIASMVRDYIALIARFGKLAPMPQPPIPWNARLYRIADFSPEATAILYRNFEQGLVERYLANREELAAVAPIVANPLLGGGAGA